MPLRLRPVADDEVPSFVESVRADYEQAMISDAGLRADEARSKAKQDFAALVREGRPLPGQQLFVLEEEQTGERVGRAWLGQRLSRPPIAFLYDIEIDGRLRGRGLGREAMLLVEREARRRGFVELRLNVFGGNETARSLYGSLGYEEFAIAMRKPLA